MELAVVLMTGIIAGWIVNLLADAIPERRPLRELWREPWQTLHTPGTRSHLWRTLCVWASAPLLGWLAYRHAGWSIETAILAIYAWFFLTIAVIDLEHRRVFNRMLVPILPVMLIANLLMGLPALTSALIGAGIGFGFFLIVALLMPGGMGMGDVKLAGVIGLATGQTGILFALSIGILAGGVAAIITLLVRRFDRKATMAYAPYLVLGAWAVLLLDIPGLLY